MSGLSLVAVASLALHIFLAHALEVVGIISSLQGASSTGFQGHIEDTRYILICLRIETTSSKCSWRNFSLSEHCEANKATQHEHLLLVGLHGGLSIAHFRDSHATQCVKAPCESIAAENETPGFLKKDANFHRNMSIFPSWLLDRRLQYSESKNESQNNTEENQKYIPDSGSSRNSF